MKICFWSTSFQADSQAMAYYWAGQTGHEVVVALDDPDAYRREAVSALMPCPGRLLPRGDRASRREIEQLGADLVVVDNHLPSFRIAPRVLVLWHGFGWRVDDLVTMRRKLRDHIGPVEKPNAAFRWQAFGDWDRDYRISHSKLAPENVVALGSPYSDWLLPGSSVRAAFDRRAAQSCYTIDIVGRQTLLLALTWHHGGVLSQWGDERPLLERLFTHVGALGANVLVRLHDRHRYERSYVSMLEVLAARHPHVQVKFKSESPDSFVDMLVSDALASNFSSIANAFYYTAKPTIHIHPHSGDGPLHSRRLRWGRVRKEKLDDPASQWKLPPDENGGLVAHSMDELLAQLEIALADATCCEARARAFCDKYVTGVDGHTRTRVAALVDAWVTA